jgi:hypothetical protein
MQGKIIGVGFQKTGTSSLRDALRILGYRVKDTTSRALIPILRNDDDKLLRIIENYDAMEDTPWYIIYKKLDRLLPGSKFILTLREEESWYKSVARHIGDLPSAHHEFVYGRGKSLPKYHKENTLKVYRKHIAGVREYFKDRPEDLLEIDFTKGEGWEKLCQFLGKDIPMAPFPHANDSRKNKATKDESLNRKFKMHRQKVKNRMKMKYIDWMGLWPEDQ